MIQFHQVTTCHGVADLYRAPCKKSQTFWLFNILAGVSFLIYFVYLVIDEYTNAAILTSISIVGSPQMTLPEMSLCYYQPFNPIKAEAIGMPKPVIHSLLRHFQLVNRIGDGQKDGIESAASLEKFLNDSGFGGNFDQCLKNISFTCTDLLVASLGGTSKKTDELCNLVRYIDHPQNGYCLILPTIIQVWPGSSAGWNLMLGVPNYPEEYRQQQYTDGYSVAFGNPMVIPMFNEYLAQPGKYTSILLSATYAEKIQYLAWPRVSNKMCENNRFNGYPACNLKCYANATLTACDCVDFGFHSLLPNVTTCNPFGTPCRPTSFIQCQTRCLPVCRQWDYTASVTSAQLNTEATMQEFGGNHKHRDMVALSVAYSNMKYKAIEQREAFTLQTTVSSVGGQLGLWMGISVITILQAIYYAIGAGCKNMFESKMAHVMNKENSKI